MLLSVYAHFLVLGLVIINSKSAHLVWLPRAQWYRWYKIHKDSIQFWTCTLILTLKTTMYFWHKTFQLMMRHHPIKCGCKKISSSVYVVETLMFDLWALTMTLNFKTANQFSCMTLWPKFGYRKFSSWRGIVHVNTHWNSEPFLWPWPWPQQSNPIFSQYNPHYNLSLIHISEPTRLD